jgi:opacity protein-like surface antigen
MNKALALFPALFCGLLLNAQDAPTARFGLKASPNMGWIKPDSKGLSANGNRTGYTFGLMMDFPIGPTGSYFFSTGMFLNNTGGQFTRAFSYEEAPATPPAVRTRELETDLKLGYIELPITMKLMTNEIGYMRYFGQVGFGTAFNIRAKADTELPVYYAPPGDKYVEKFETVENEDYMDNINLFKASLIVGAGLEYNFSGNTSLVAGITYNGGFTNILKDIQINEKNAKAMANYIELNLGVFF